MSTVQIKASDVKALRDKTGVGMMDCKNALEKSGGDFDKALTILKELGLAAAQKRSGRATKEGKIFSKIEGSRAVLLELLCETDFVARNDQFLALGAELTGLVMAQSPTAATPPMQELVTTAIGKIKENIGIGRFETVTAEKDELLTGYVHGDKIGVLVKLRLEPATLRDDARVKEAAMDCALHVAAFAPVVLRPADVDPAYMKEQEAIFLVQAKATGKPENVVQGIVKGKLKKHMSEISLLEQLHVKQTKKSVADVLKELGTQVGGTVEISGYRYYRLGSE